MSGIFCSVYNVVLLPSYPAIYRVYWAQQLLQNPVSEPTSIFRTEITQIGCAGECLFDSKRKSYCHAVFKDGARKQWDENRQKHTITLH